MSRRPVQQQEAASAFYAGLDAEVGHHAAMWHTYKVGQLMATDHDRICRRYGLSMSDLHLLGAARMEAATQRRATDLAKMLYVSHAVLSTRVAKLERKGLLTRIPSATDRRAYELKLTPAGLKVIDAAIEEVSKSSHFVRCYRRLSAQDQSALGRIMGELHNLLDREVMPLSRAKA